MGCSLKGLKSLKCGFICLGFLCFLDGYVEGMLPDFVQRLISVAALMIPTA